MRAAIPTKIKVVIKLTEGNAEESSSVEPELEEPESAPEFESESEPPSSVISMSNTTLRWLLSPSEVTEIVTSHVRLGCAEDGSIPVSYTHLTLPTKA